MDFSMPNRAHWIQWVIPLVVGIFGFLCFVYALLVERRSDSNLVALALISAAFLGAGIFNKISLTKEGFIIETAQANFHSISALEAAVKANADALQQVSKRVDEVVNLTVELSKLPQASNALTAQAQALSNDSSDLTSALQSLGVTVNNVAAGVAAAKTTIGNLVEYFTGSPDQDA